MFDNVNDGVYFVDLGKKITFWNKAADRLTGYSSAEVAGHTCSDNILVHVDESGKQLYLDGCPLRAAMTDGVYREAHVFLRHKNGYRIPMFVKVQPIRNELGEIVGGMETFTDDSYLRSLESRVSDLERLSLIDALTGAGNRRFADITLNTRIGDFKRYGWPFGVVLFDIDDFKIVNDDRGHKAGDEVLRMLTMKVRGTIREPRSSLFRWGGEEFLVVTSNIGLAAIGSLAERIRALVASSALPLQNGPLSITISAGATTAGAGDDPERIITRADALLYDAKKSGKNRCLTSPSDSRAPMRA